MIPELLPEKVRIVAGSESSIDVDDFHGDEGIVEKIQGEEALVLIGSEHYWFPLSDLQVVTADGS